MPSILDTILAEKKREVAALGERREPFGARADRRRPFVEALRQAQGMAVIAEVKRASPSKGLIRPDFDPVAIAQGYAAAGASAISVLTDEKFFQGSLAYLRAVRAAVSLPVLRKDFIVDTVQVAQTAEAGADAMLLIAAALSDSQMAELYGAALEYDVEPLIEVHNREELHRALQLKPPLIGINNRSLATFVTDVAVSIDLIKSIPPGVVVVSESGVESGEQVDRLREAGVRAVLVGESLVRLQDPSALMKELMYGAQD
jgi:indole-3-glycerol phosphate synthase